MTTAPDDLRTLTVEEVAEVLGMDAKGKPHD
jgi:hypothetical protein